jgi:hypothetical protein
MAVIIRDVPSSERDTTLGAAYLEHGPRGFLIVPRLSLQRRWLQVSQHRIQVKLFLCGLAYERGGHASA